MANRWHGKESRWGDRVKVNVPVQLWVNTVAGAPDRTGAAGCISNLSLSGALVKGKVDLGVNSLIEVNIQMPPPSQHPHAITAFISRNCADGVGIEWCDFAPTVVKDLLRSSSIPLPL